MTAGALNILAALIATTGLTYLPNELNYRTAKQIGSWPDNARILWPVMKGCRLNMVLIPILVAIALDTISYPRPIQYISIALAIMAATAASWPLIRRFNPEISFRRWLHLSTATFGIVILCFGPLVVAAACMLAGAERMGWILLTLALSIRILFIFNAGLWLGRLFGLSCEVPEDLCQTVKSIAADFNVKVKHVFVFKSRMANAFALQSTSSMLFTEPFLRILTAQEIAAVVRHEAEHLRESRTIVLSRIAIGFILYAGVAIIPIGRRGGALPSVALAATLLFAVIIFKRFSRKLEYAADKNNASAQADREVMATALTKIYQFNFIPVVLGLKNSTHPELYDRLMALGVTPNYPRPKKPASWCWSTLILYLLFIVAIAWTVANRDQSRL